MDLIGVRKTSLNSEFKVLVIPLTDWLSYLWIPRLNLSKQHNTFSPVTLNAIAEWQNYMGTRTELRADTLYTVRVSPGTWGSSRSNIFWRQWFIKLIPTTFRVGPYPIQTNLWTTCIANVLAVLSRCKTLLSLVYILVCIVYKMCSGYMKLEIYIYYDDAIFIVRN